MDVMDPGSDGMRIIWTSSPEYSSSAEGYFLAVMMGRGTTLKDVYVLIEWGRRYVRFPGTSVLWFLILEQHPRVCVVECDLVAAGQIPLDGIPAPHPSPLCVRNPCGPTTFDWCLS